MGGQRQVRTHPRGGSKMLLREAVRPHRLCARRSRLMRNSSPTERPRMNYRRRHWSHCEMSAVDRSQRAPGRPHVYYLRTRRQGCARMKSQMQTQNQERMTAAPKIEKTMQRSLIRRRAASRDTARCSIRGRRSWVTQILTARCLRPRPQFRPPAALQPCPRWNWRARQSKFLEPRQWSGSHLLVMDERTVKRGRGCCKKKRKRFASSRKTKRRQAAEERSRKKTQATARKPAVRTRTTVTTRMCTPTTPSCTIGKTK
mmetsp:Transcript_21564/g.54405  ORF Transcript_21564/g.54405 Transcript_21564/m.54405 type:complete len:258 (+) Transcript_21564:1890-2663(+)